MAEPTVVHAWAKNSREEIRASLTEYRGHKLADLRVFVADENDVDHPTKKGISVRVDDLPKMLEAVQALIAASNGGRAAA